MITVLFVCHGNICRSPMAEFIFRDMVKKEGLSDRISCASAATSREELGNPVHYGTREVLSKLGISARGKVAVQMTKQDYNDYDYIFAMDKMNIRNIFRIIGDDPDMKVATLLDRDIADPWYTGNFDATYRDVLEGCTALLERLKKDC